MSAPLPSAEEQARFMALALQEAMKCEPTEQAFCVGAVIVRDGQPLSCGYSRELPGNTHAEQCAVDKLVTEKGEAAASAALLGTDIYTTMEPCSVRLSGNKPCTDRLLEVGIGRVFLGTQEPDDFVTCEGIQKLKNAGVQVHTVPGFAEKALEIARRKQQ